MPVYWRFGTVRQPKSIAFAWGLTLSVLAMAPPATADQPHNVILFVPDGLRALMVTPEQTPTMAAIES